MDAWDRHGRSAPRRCRNNRRWTGAEVERNSAEDCGSEAAHVQLASLVCHATASQMNSVRMGAGEQEHSNRLHLCRCARGGDRTPQDVEPPASECVAQRLKVRMDAFRDPRTPNLRVLKSFDPLLLNLKVI